MYIFDAWDSFSFFYNFLVLSHFLKNTNMKILLIWYIWFQWLNHGKDITNRRYANDEVLINPLTVSRLRLKWKFFTGKDISATPAGSSRQWSGLFPIMEWIFVCCKCFHWYFNMEAEPQWINRTKWNGNCCECNCVKINPNDS